MFSPILVRFFAVLALAVLAGCSSVDPQSYASEKPALDLRRYFDGTIEGHGLFINREGRVERRFVVRIAANWQGEVGTLDEDFVWSDGKTEKRIWTLKPVAGQTGRWRGTAADVVGEAAGTVAGNALHWTYTFALKTESGSVYNIDFDDWMYLVDERVLINRAVMRFWGFKVGEVLISFRKV